MNKRLNLLLLLSGLVFLVTGCNQEDFNGDTSVTTENGDIRFEIGFTPTTRVATGADFESSWEAGDAIGIFALDANTDELFFSNEKLVYDGSEWTGEELYWRGKTLKFYAYYPYDETATNPKAIKFYVKSDQNSTTGEDANKRSGYSLSDLMTATDVSGKSAGETVALSFRHEFALVQVEVSPAGIESELSEYVTLSLKGVWPGVTLNLTGGDEPVVSPTYETGNVKMYRVEQAGDANYLDSYTFRAIIPAQTFSASGKDLFMMSNGVGMYTSGLDKGVQLKAGQAEIFTRSFPGNGNDGQ